MIKVQDKDENPSSGVVANAKRQKICSGRDGRLTMASPAKKQKCGTPLTKESRTHFVLQDGSAKHGDQNRDKKRIEHQHHKPERQTCDRHAFAPAVAAHADAAKDDREHGKEQTNGRK